MHVLSIMHYDNMNMGCPTAIVEIPEGKKKDDVFLAWLRREMAEPELTMKQAEEKDYFLYTWEEYTVDQVL